MKIEARRTGGVQILGLSGELTSGPGCAAVRSAIERVFSAPGQKLVINLQGIRAMDSSGLGELAHAQQLAASSGGGLCLLHVEDKVRELMQRTRVLSRFATYDQESLALRSLR